jgi:CHAT domain-containing protein
VLATGPLTVLPIHAAGRHPRTRINAHSTDSVLDRVISSYTPTLTALARARQRSAPAGTRHLAVGMPTTPGLTPLPAVPEELRVLERHFPPGIDNQQLAGPQAIRAAVLGAMQTCSWVHMACHAGQKHSDPDRSGFALWDGRLTISDLASLPTQSRDLAFLSACETGSGSIQYIDETIHLAAAMQFLGYRHVIATMWAIADSPAPDIADAVYTSITGNGAPNANHAAEALHYAIHSLRKADPTNPLLWAPYIHLGA